MVPSSRFRWVAPNHWKHCAFRARPEEQPRKPQFIKIHKAPDVAFRNIFGFLGENAKP